MPVSQAYYVVISGSGLVYKAKLNEDIGYTISNNYEQLFGDGGAVISKGFQFFGISTGQTTWNPKRQTSAGEFTISLPTKLVVRENPIREIVIPLKNLHKMAVPKIRTGGVIGQTKEVDVYVSDMLYLKECGIGGIDITMSRALCTYGGRHYPIYVEVSIEVMPIKPLTVNYVEQMLRF